MNKFVKPSKPGLVVRNHGDKFRPLPDEGKMVVWDGTWARRERDGDVLVSDSAPKAEKPSQQRKTPKPSKTEE